jgi:hypothetical protein
MTFGEVMAGMCESNGGESEARRKSATIGYSLEDMARAAMSLLATPEEDLTV